MVRSPSLQTGRADLPHPAFRSVGARCSRKERVLHAVSKDARQTFSTNQANCTRLVPPPASPVGHSRWFVFRISGFHLSTFMRSLRSTGITLFHRYYGRSDFVLGGSLASEKHELRLPQADLPDSCARLSDHSVSNHLRIVRRSRRIVPCRFSGAREFCSPRQASPFPSRLAQSRRPNRVHVVLHFRRTLLRTGPSRPVAPHPVFPQRSYGSIPHASSAHRSGLSPLQPSTISGALGTARCAVSAA